MKLVGFGDDQEEDLFLWGKMDPGLIAENVTSLKLMMVSVEVVSPRKLRNFSRKKGS
jgi:hypothetical protein